MPSTEDKLREEERKQYHNHNRDQEDKTRVIERTLYREIRSLRYLTEDTKRDNERNQHYIDIKSTRDAEDKIRKNERKQYREERDISYSNDNKTRERPTHRFIARVCNALGEYAENIGRDVYRTVQDVGHRTYELAQDMGRLTYRFIARVGNRLGEYIETAARTCYRHLATFSNWIRECAQTERRKSTRTIPVTAINRYADIKLVAHHLHNINHFICRPKLGTEEKNKIMISSQSDSRLFDRPSLSMKQESSPKTEQVRIIAIPRYP